MPTRPRNPTGFVRRHPETLQVRWQGIVQYPDPDRPGKWKQRSKTFLRKAEAQAWVDAALAEHRRNPAYKPPTEERFGDYLQRWLDTVAAGRVRDTTLAGYRVVARHALAHLGHRALKDLTPLDIQGVYAACAQDGLAPSTIPQLHVVLRRACEDAVEWGLIPVNPVRRAKPPKVQPPRLTIPTLEQGRALLQAVDGDRLQALWWFLALTGCRRGEALGLRWEDVDEAAGTVAIQRTLVGKGAHRTLHDPKTAHGRRRIALSPALQTILRQHRQRQLLERVAAGPDWHETGFVFTTRHGLWLAPDWVRKRFKAILKQAGLPATIRIHDLRHAMATVWLSNGVPAKVVSERLGHASVAITLQLYAHVLPGMQAQAAQAMDALWTGSDTPASVSTASVRAQRHRRR